LAARPAKVELAYGGQHVFPLVTGGWCRLHAIDGQAARVARFIEL